VVFAGLGGISGAGFSVGLHSSLTAIFSLSFSFSVSTSQRNKKAATTTAAESYLLLILSVLKPFSLQFLIFISGPHRHSIISFSPFFFSFPNLNILPFPLSFVN